MKINISEEDLKDWGINSRICCIYKITNTKNGLVYIGQTVNLRSRASDYKNAYKKEGKRGMYHYITAENTDDFVLEIVERCEQNELNEKEMYYIEKYKATDPKYGYNAYIGITTPYSNITNQLKSIAHKGLKESSDTKRKKSNLIIAIGDDKIILCDSGKLFGDYVGTTKDMVKNYIRSGFCLQGYYLFYDDDMKRHELFLKIKDKKTRKARYTELMSLLSSCEYEGVETIYSILTDAIGPIYELKYENVNANGEHFLTPYKLPYITEEIEKEATVEDLVDEYEIDDYLYAADYDSYCDGKYEDC